MSGTRILPHTGSPRWFGGEGASPPLDRRVTGNGEGYEATGHDGPGKGGEDHPCFSLGRWRFRVHSKDPGLLEDLRLACSLLVASSRPEVEFTVRLIRCTEQGRLPGWGWTRERISGT